MFNLTNIADERYLSAIEIYLSRRGYEATRLYDSPIDFLAIDGDVAALVAVSASEKGFEDDALTRKEYEIAMLNVARQGLVETGTSVRFDAISICAVGDEKALIRHHLDRFSS